jgi:hypothetical protein
VKWPEEYEDRIAARGEALEKLARSGVAVQFAEVEDGSYYDTLQLTIGDVTVRIRSQDSEEYSSWLEFVLD